MRAVLALRLVAATSLLLTGVAGWATSASPRVTAQTSFTLTIPDAANLVDDREYTWSVTGTPPQEGSFASIALFGYPEANCGGEETFVTSTRPPSQGGDGVGTFIHDQRTSSYRAELTDLNRPTTNCVNVTTVSIGGCPAIAPATGVRPPRSPRPGAAPACPQAPESPRPERSPRPTR